MEEEMRPKPSAQGWSPVCDPQAGPPPLPRRAAPHPALSGLVSRVVRRNPAYLVSAALMILGVYTIAQPGTQAIGNIPAVLATFSTLQFYELLLVGIAIFLVCRRRVMDDGATLVLIEAIMVVACFVLADELAFKDRYRPAGLALGLVGTLLAACRLGALGAAVGRRLPFSAVGIVLGLLLLWNGVAPAWVSRLHDADSPITDAACLAGWWAVAGMAFALAIVAGRARGPLPWAGRPFVNGPLAPWAIGGIVVATTALHQHWVGYILDAPTLLSDLIPLATVAALGVLNLMAAGRERAGVWEHAVAGAPAALCLAALLSGAFEPLVREAATVPLRHAFVHELRTLTWPTAWLALIAAVTSLHAWRRRSTGLAHQAAMLLALTALFSTAKSPTDLCLEMDGFLLALTAYFAVTAVVERLPRWMAAGLVTANWFILRQWPAKAVAGVFIDPTVGVLALIGLSCWTLWLVFRQRVPRWVPHLGAVFLVEAALGLNFAPSTKGPGWLLAILTIGTAAGLAAMGHRFKWWSYYLLAAGTVLLTPVREITSSKQAWGSESGWLLVIGAFIALGLGFLVSLRKGGGVSPLPAGPIPDRRALQ